MNSWLDEFKIAVIEEDLKKIEALHSSMPEFENLEELMYAQALISEGTEVFKKARSQTAKAMSQLKKSLEFQKNMMGGTTRFDKSY